MQVKGHPRRILIVEDNRDAASTLALLLEAMGHSVEIALNGHSALEIARRFRPDMVFLDLVLPDWDGCDLARELREEAGSHDVHIFAVTGYGDDEVQRRAMQAGCKAHLLKPVDPAIIEKLVQGG